MACRSVLVKYLIISGAFAVVILAGLVYVWTRPIPQITEEACARIQPGMAATVVEAIIGAPAGIYISPLQLLGYETLDDFTWIAGTAEKKHWENRAGYINVYFDSQGQVLVARYSTKP